MKLELTWGGASRPALALLLLLATPWNVAAARAGTGTQQSFDEFVERLAAEWMRADP